MSTCDAAKALALADQLLFPRTPGERPDEGLAQVHHDLCNWIRAPRIAPPTPEGTDIEALAANVHDQWMATKRAGGVTSRRSESGEELMVPYVDLSEPQKEMDRVLVRTVLRAIDATTAPAPRPPTHEGIDAETLIAAYVFDARHEWDIDAINAAHMPGADFAAWLREFAHKVATIPLRLPPTPEGIDALRATPELKPTYQQATSDEEIALELATWLRGVVRDTPAAVDREIALARAAWLEEIADRARVYAAAGDEVANPPAPRPGGCSDG